MQRTTLTILLAAIATCVAPHHESGDGHVAPHSRIVRLADDAQDSGTEVQDPEQQEEQTEEQQGPGAAA